MPNVVENLNEKAEQLNKVASSTDLALAEMRIQFETMMEMQKEERIETQKMSHEELDKMRKHYGRIITGLILTICLILGSVIGGAIYLFSNYDFAYILQDPTIGGNGDLNLYDGIHYNYSRGD